MAFLQVEFFSNVLKVASTVNVILPEKSMGIGVTAGGGEGKLPKVLYLLHGYSDDHSICATLPSTRWQSSCRR